MDWKTQYRKVAVLPKLIYGVNAISAKTAAGFFVDVHKLILKFRWKFQGPRVAETILKKNKLGGLTFSEFQTYCKPRL